MSNSQYRVEAQVKDGDRLLLVTDSRDRAIRYAGTLMVNKSYIHVSVEHQGQVWIGDAIGRMP